ncbi:MAG TPA: nickel-binding protein [Nitrososphaeraceae archaeon]|jgi:hypothetical protein|nr:nickel-binding protein [Nitrososphaeraceae archaeon]
MPRYLDSHKMSGFDEEKLKQAKNSPKDEFGVTHSDILYNKEEDKLYCILDAPDKQSVEKHHEKFGIKCDWITEVKTV